MLMFGVLQSVASQGLLYRVYNNSGRVEPAVWSGITGDVMLTLDGETSFSSELSGTVTFPSRGVHEFHCDFVRTSVAFVWVDGHTVCHDGNAYAFDVSVVDNPLIVNTTAGLTLPFRAHVYADNRENSSSNSTVTVRWSAPGAEPTPIPKSVLSPELPKVEQLRDDMQRSMARGWGTWLHDSILDMTKLPQAATLGISICNVESGVCISRAVPGGNAQSNVNAHTRVGIHASDRSYAQFYVGPGANTTASVQANVSVEFSVHGGDGEDITMVLTPIMCADGCSNYVVRVTPRYAWYRVGSFYSDGDTLHIAPAGSPNITIHALGPQGSLHQQWRQHKRTGSHGEKDLALRRVKGLLPCIII